MIRIRLNITVLLITLLTASVAGSKEITVCSTCGVTTIAQALAESSDGDVIILKPGIYKEHSLTVANRIELRADEGAVLDADKKGPGITIKHDSVRIAGLTIRNVDVSYINDLSAVMVDNVSGCVIERNVIEDTFFAIYLAGSSMCKVEGNRIQGQAKTESSSGNGIHLWKCSAMYVADNQITGHRDGIYLEFVSSSSIRGNYSGRNLRYGLHFMFSDSNSYSGNTFENNGAGVAVMYSKFIKMTGNTFKNNWGESAYGLLLKELYDGLLEDNLFFRNTAAIHVEGSNRIEIVRNDFIENGWALYLLGNSYENKVTANNFINNTFDVSSNSSRNNNFYSENYWDKYKGYDLNRDGTGDVPYRPVSLFSVILEKSPESIIMLRSVAVDILDAIERVIPSVIPETLIDDRPKFTRYSNDRDKGTS
ncbi:MAG: nitrous oxide reductase family maturation protein NosD [Ignavibacteria bacterium]|nr:nitrous oxide reductase family maturation protein NosD [Ignavibacteria bacterium]